MEIRTAKIQGKEIHVKVIKIENGKVTATIYNLGEMGHDEIIVFPESSLLKIGASHD